MYFALHKHNPLQGDSLTGLFKGLFAYCAPTQKGTSRRGNSNVWLPCWKDLKLQGFGKLELTEQSLVDPFPNTYFGFIAVMAKYDPVKDVEQIEAEVKLDESRLLIESDAPTLVIKGIHV